MSEILLPHQVTYRLCKIFAREWHPEDSAWPSTAGYTAKVLGERYAEDYDRCADVTRMIREDLSALGAASNPKPQKRWWQFWRHDA